MRKGNCALLRIGWPSSPKALRLCHDVMTNERREGRERFNVLQSDRSPLPCSWVRIRWLSVSLYKSFLSLKASCKKLFLRVQDGHRSIGLKALRLDHVPLTVLEKRVRSTS
ncbi:hypothetical protein TNCV_2798391 [Trichonephila clavipes]|nr:hypothetical protein TNCV_2798391 [Trichonephila clavipes]